jgi:hypothetical protein
MAEAGWADVRPNDHDVPGLSRIPPCSRCGHDEHAFRCLVLVDPHHHEDVVCPCRGGVPIPGVFASSLHPNR